MYDKSGRYGHSNSHVGQELDGIVIAKVMHVRQELGGTVIAIVMYCALLLSFIINNKKEIHVFKSLNLVVLGD